MYVLSTGACSLPNSSTPMSADAIAAQDAFIAGVGSQFDNGNQILNSLLAALGGNPIDASQGDAGIATAAVPPPGGSPFPSSGPVAVAQRFGGGPNGGGTPLGVPAALRAARAAARRASSGSACVPPQVQPVVTVFAVPIVTTPRPTVVSAGSPSPRPTTPAPSAPASGSAAPALMMVDCWDKPGGVDVWVPGPKYGLNQQGSPSTGPKCWTPSGVSGFFDAFTDSNPGSGVLWGSLAAGAFLLWAVAQSGKRGKRRRV